MKFESPGLLCDAKRHITRLNKAVAATSVMLTSRRSFKVASGDRCYSPLTRDRVLRSGLLQPAGRASPA